MIVDIAVAVVARTGDENDAGLAGADGVAVISAVCAADDPEAAARDLLAAMYPRV